MSQTHADSLQPGELFAGRYRIERRIKAGAMGAVYEVTDEKTDTRRALKVMLPGAFDDPDLRERFVREAKVTGRVESDHIVKNMDAGVDEATGHLFLVMELLRGEELGRMIRQRKRLPPNEVLVYLRQFAFALDKTHAAGIVHRDLKPDNLFVAERDDGSPCIKILDFGIAKVLAESMEVQATRPLGTPLYAAPEQAQGIAVGPATDLYALGQIAYTMLVGESYWGADAGAGGAESLLAKVYVGAPERATERALRRKNVVLPAAFDAWFAKATAVKPEDRFASGRAAIGAFAAAFDVSARDAMSSVLEMAAPLIPTSSPTPGTVYRSAPERVDEAVVTHPAVDTLHRATLPFAAKALPIAPVQPAVSPEEPTTAVLITTSASGALGETNLTATSRTWAKPLQRKTGLAAVVLLGVIGIVGVVGFVMRNEAHTSSKEAAASVSVMPSAAPVAVVKEVPSAVVVVEKPLEARSEGTTASVPNPLPTAVKTSAIQPTATVQPTAASTTKFKGPIRRPSIDKRK